MVDKVHMEVNLRKHGRIVLEKYTLNSCLGCTAIVDEGAKNICLTSEGLGTESKGGTGQSKGEQGHLGI